jgi:hypothetical protein
MPNETDCLADARNTHYTDELTPVWVSDDEGDLIFFAMLQDGQVKEWVWL